MSVEFIPNPVDDENDLAKKARLLSYKDVDRLVHILMEDETPTDKMMVQKVAGEAMRQACELAHEGAEDWNCYLATLLLLSENCLLTVIGQMEMLKLQFEIDEMEGGFDDSEG